MISYPYIQDLFKNILSKSKAIEGRFFVCPKFGIEINTDQLGEVLTDLVNTIKGNKYPLSLMMPPRSTGKTSARKEEWENYRIVMFFLKTSFYDSNNQISNQNVNTRTSQHTIPEDWHDMKRCAVNFIRVLDQLQRNFSINNYFRLSADDKIYNPVSNIGVDRAAGVRVDFSVSLFTGCEIEDYNIEDISSITLPVADSHPEHNL